MLQSNVSATRGYERRKKESFLLFKMVENLFELLGKLAPVASLQAVQSTRAMLAQQVPELQAE